jgi:hypothetical protein
LDSASRITEQRLEAEIHVHLIMTMEKRQAGLIGHQVHGHAPEIGDDYRIFHNAAGWLAVYLHYLEEMPMDVHGMCIVGAIAKEDAVF